MTNLVILASLLVTNTSREIVGISTNQQAVVRVVEGVSRQVTYGSRVRRGFFWSKPVPFKTENVPVGGRYWHEEIPFNMPKPAEKPVISNQKPVISDQKEKPVISDQKPVISNQKEKPVISDQKEKPVETKPETEEGK